MVRSGGFFILALAVLAFETSGWYYPYNPPVVFRSWDYFKPTSFYEKPEQTPLELMVDITNSLGVTILQHQSFSKVNFAFSPYGVVSVLVVLYEGSRGESAAQIQRAVKFPFDKDLIRTGFRDMHRHLKSYFSHEGYLSGIALNKDVPALKPDFKRILHFYGYDVDFSDLKENQKPVNENTSSSTAKTSSLSTAAEPYPTATTLLATTNASFIEVTTEVGSTHGDVQQETTKLMEETTNKSNHATVQTTEIGEDPMSVTESSTESSATKQPESETDKTTTETGKTEALNQQEVDNSTIPNDILETKETTTLANIMNDKNSSENETDEENDDYNKEITTKVNENLHGNEVTTTEIKNEITTQGIGAALDNGMLIPQVGDLETTINNIEFGDGEVSSTSSVINVEVTEVPTAISTKAEAKESADVTQVTEETESNSEMLTSSLNVKTTAATSASELSTLTEIKGTSLPPTETEIFTTDNSKSKTTATTSGENLTTSEPDFSQVTENEIPSTPVANTLNSVIDELMTYMRKPTEPASESSGETTVASTLTSDEKTTITNLAMNSPDNSKSGREGKKAFIQMLNLKLRKRSVSPNCVGMWSQMSLAAGSNATKSSRGRSSRSFRMKRTVSGYLGSPVDADFAIHLQNGMYGTYAFRNLNFYNNLHWRPFLVNSVVDTPVPMIIQANIFPYGYIPQLQARALEFPLDDIRYKLLILLPVERRGLKQLIYALGNCALTEIIANLRPFKVRVSLPMFMAEGFVVLTSSLQKLGIRDVFESDKANLSGMSTDSELYVRNIEQSITVVIRNYVEMPDFRTRMMAARHAIHDFEATHPFVYFVLDAATNVALMAGQILDPLSTRIY